MVSVHDADGAGLSADDPDDPIEAATLEGASRWQLFRHIVLPYIRPVLVVCALFRLIDSFKAFPPIYVLTNGGPGSVTEVTNFYGFIQAFNFSYWGYASAIATVMLVGVFLLELAGRADWAGATMTSASGTWSADKIELGHDEGIAAGPLRAAGSLAGATRRRSWLSRHARALTVALLLVVVLSPFLWLVQLAFWPAADIFDDSLLFTPTLDGFISLLQGNFLKSFGNSLLVQHGCRPASP